MIPGEIKVKSTEIEINKHHPETVIEVKNTGDRPIKLVLIFISLKLIKL